MTGVYWVTGDADSNFLRIGLGLGFMSHRPRGAPRTAPSCTPPAAARGARRRPRAAAPARARAGTARPAGRRGRPRCSRTAACGSRPAARPGRARVSLGLSYPMALSRRGSGGVHGWGRAGACCPGGAANPLTPAGGRRSRRPARGPAAWACAGPWPRAQRRAPQHPSTPRQPGRSGQKRVHVCEAAPTATA
jgi:hypothetical protein